MGLNMLQESYDVLDPDCAITFLLQLDYSCYESSRMTTIPYIVKCA